MEELLTFKSILTGIAMDVIPRKYDLNGLILIGSQLTPRTFAFLSKQISMFGEKSIVLAEISSFQVIV